MLRAAELTVIHKLSTTCVYCWPRLPVVRRTCPLPARRPVSITVAGDRPGCLVRTDEAVPGAAW